MKLKNIFAWSVVGVSALFFQSCSAKFEKNEEGLEYKYFKKGNGTQPKQGEFVVYDLVLTNTSNKDTVLINTGEEGVPQVYRYDTLSFKDNILGSGFAMLKKGDSVEFRLPVDSLQSNGMVPTTWNTKSGDMLNFDIGVKQVLTLDEFQEWRIEQMKKIQELNEEKEKEQLTKDEATIDAYLKKNNINYKTTESGLRYVIENENPSGEKAEAGDEVSVNYVGKLMNGTVFDTNNPEVAKEAGIFTEGRPYEPLNFYLGRGQVIKGWDEGIGLLRTGEKAVLYIPSPLAYGSRPAGDKIPANSILIFDVELVKVTKKDKENK
ncbi:FKBP-type peptidyl-prolyl cis-trans isomerase [Aureibacter tunicatorum]|uniref:Peptidyl-prolyl cis-trans isomerase n=1 Tax=Aureibacter tunicatorum TaxID=866807 RepID=A0AAE3XSZ6_9BACT|nr:FKBP-type peptidyl-prolyl cis-trans isomerase [Aureibacter tunicatorum]MDR6241321.1 FKBP-type peptidyl-prolyl cis-trans isomerase [Aureibacter tunicatorum]BDD03580.1 hypothetical protein AUTU_10630 [Aureibacter tunicatorum]